jgi:hypothetical protein
VSVPALKEKTLGLITSQRTTMSTFVFVDEDAFFLLSPCRFVQENSTMAVNILIRIQTVLDQIL